jgi:hypothetical protein
MNWVALRIVLALIEAMPGQLLSINAFRAAGRNLCVSIKLAT